MHAATKNSSFFSSSSGPYSPSGTSARCHQMGMLRSVNLFLAFLLCPFIGTSAFLAPPPRSMEIMDAKEADKMHSLLGGKLLVKVSDHWTKLQAGPSEEQICEKSSHQNATLLRSISKSTGDIVHLHSHFDVVFCENSPNNQDQQRGEVKEEEGEEASQCAMGANCASVFRWARALVRHSHPRIHGPVVQDWVLVPVDCLCVLGWAENFGAHNEPVVLE